MQGALYLIRRINSSPDKTVGGQPPFKSLNMLETNQKTAIITHCTESSDPRNQDANSAVKRDSSPLQAMHGIISIFNYAVFRKYYPRHPDNFSKEPYSVQQKMKTDFLFGISPDDQFTELKKRLGAESRDDERGAHKNYDLIRAMPSRIKSELYGLADNSIFPAIRARALVDCACFKAENFLNFLFSSGDPEVMELRQGIRKMHRSILSADKKDLEIKLSQTLSSDSERARLFAVDCIFHLPLSYHAGLLEEALKSPHFDVVQKADICIQRVPKREQQSLYDAANAAIKAHFESQ